MLPRARNLQECTVFGGWGTAASRPYSGIATKREHKYKKKKTPQAVHNGRYSTTSKKGERKMVIMTERALDGEGGEGRGSMSSTDTMRIIPFN